MTPYHLKIAPSALRQIRALPAKQKKTLLTLMESLAFNPRPPGTKKIEGLTGLYSEEINHLRVLYKIEDQEVLVLLVKT